MKTLIGRERELAEIGGFLEAARSGRVATGISVAGVSGIGKTAVFQEAIKAAREAGWLSAAIGCHRIQSGLPFIGARRIASALVKALGADHERYDGGLTKALDTATTVSEALFRFIEGVLHDYPVLLAIDDSQWLDPESSELIESLMQSFADRALVVLAMQRTDGEGNAPIGSPEHRITLATLDAGPAEEIIRLHYPQANADVVGAILTHTTGSPIDIVAIAQSARENNARDASGIDASVRTLIARQLNALEPALRTFLQLCSLIPEPIEYPVLAQLWPDQGELTRLIEAASGRYLVQDGSTLRFLHALIAASVRQTMPVEIPYRRRILGALLKIEAPNLEEYERIIQQARACGDTELEYDNLLKLANKAIQESAHGAAAHGYERALELMSPPADQLVSFYARYAAVLATHDRLGEVKNVLSRALEDAANAGLKAGTGPLAAMLVGATWRTDGVEAALETYAKYITEFPAGPDRLQLQSTAAWLYACAVDANAFQQIKTELLLYPEKLPPEARMRLHVADGSLQARQGHYDFAVPAFEEAIHAAKSIQSAHRFVPEVTKILVDFSQFGGVVVQTRLTDMLRRTLRDGTNGVLELLRALADLSGGQFEAAAATVRDALATRPEAAARRHLLSLSAAMAALTKSPSPHAAAIHAELRYVRGTRNDTLLPLAAWMAASLAATDPKEAARLLHYVLERITTPLDMATPFLPVSTVLAAHRLGDAKSLRRLSTMQGVWIEQTPWGQAHRDLAIGLARAFTGDASAKPFLMQAASGFDQLDAPLFAALAALFADPRDEKAGALLRTLGIADLPEGNRKRKASEASPANGALKPTNREREIAALVSSGQTNREIAEQLFLSERTIEAHLSNIFNKLGVSSRTQLTAWYLTNSE
ncbi:MAG: hypothetical protein NVSMB31_11610 [Vulcanimicrobiaceae bacterium]